MGMRFERCAVCGLSWAVSKGLDLTGKRYICPVCEQKDREKLKRVKVKKGKVKHG